MMTLTQMGQLFQVFTPSTHHPLFSFTGKKYIDVFTKFAFFKKLLGIEAGICNDIDFILIVCL